MRKLLIAGGALVLLFVVADTAVKRYAESRAAGILRDEMDLAVNPEISIGGWPFLLALVEGEFPSVSISMDSVQRRGIELSEVEVDLVDVQFSLSRKTVVARRGEGRAIFPASALNEALERQGVDARVSFSGGRVVVASSAIPGEFAARLSIVGDELRIESDEGFSVQVAFPLFVNGLHYESVRMVGDEAELRFGLDDPEFGVAG